MSFLYDIHEVLGQYYVIQVDGFCEERGDVVGGEGSDAASYPGYQEGVLRMLGREPDELVHIRPDGVRAPVHGGYSVALSLKADTCAPDGSEVLEGCARRSSSMYPLKVGAKDKYFIFCEMCYSFRCKSSVVHSLMFITMYCKYCAKEGLGSGVIIERTSFGMVFAKRLFNKAQTEYA